MSTVAMLAMALDDLECTKGATWETMSALLRESLTADEWDFQRYR
jgi:hypothetical protein